MTAARLTYLVLALGLATNLGFAAWRNVVRSEGWWPTAIAAFWVSLPYLLYAVPAIAFRRWPRAARTLLGVAVFLVAGSAAILIDFLVVHFGPNSALIYVPLVFWQLVCAALTCLVGLVGFVVILLRQRREAKAVRTETAS